jgi:hypothetical protein
VTLIEAMWFLLHVTTFLAVTVIVGLQHGWLIGVLSGVGATTLLILSVLLVVHIGEFLRRGQ